MAGKFTWGVKTKRCWESSINFLYSKICWQHPAMFAFTPIPPMIWIFTEGDEIKFRLPLKIFSTLTPNLIQNWPSKGYIHSNSRHGDMQMAIHITICHLRSIHKRWRLCRGEWENMIRLFLWLCLIWKKDGAKKLPMSFMDSFQVNFFHYNSRNPSDIYIDDI